MNDKQLQEQINALSTLSGGIVFGKEEAWDKLQARMDKKTTPKISLKYWMAVAAVLLIMVCIAPFYFSDNKEVSKDDKEVIAPVMNNEPIALPQNTAPVAVAVPKETSIQKQRISTTHIVSNAPATNVQIMSEPAIVEVPQVDNEVVKSTLESISQATIPVMNVVHINDIERGLLQAQQTTTLAQKDMPEDLRKMPVHYINDVIREEHEIKLLLRENRFSFGRNIFSRPAYNDANSVSNTEESDQSPHLLKNILNTQN